MAVAMASAAFGTGLTLGLGGVEAIVAAVRRNDIDALSSGLLRWLLAITHAKRLGGSNLLTNDILDDFQSAAVALLKALPAAAAKAADRPDDEVPKVLKGYLRSAIIHALLRGHQDRQNWPVFASFAHLPSDSNESPFAHF